jgi:hypothetical protein
MRKVRRESRRWIAPQVLKSPYRLPIDPAVDFVPFVPLPDPKRSAWAILCPSGCDTELIILPDHAGQWVECPTCGFRFLGPHPAQPRMVAEARARAARAAAKEAETAGRLAALSKTGAQPASSAAKAPAPPEPEEVPLAELAPEQARVMGLLEMLVEESRDVPRLSLPPKMRRAVAKAKPAPKPLAQQDAKAASVLEELEKLPRRPPARPPRVIPEPPRRAAAPVELPPGELTPQETMAIDALEALAEATLPARKAPAPLRPLASSKPLAAKPAAPLKPPVTPRPAPNRAAQRLALGARPRRKRARVAGRPSRALARTAAPAASLAPARVNHNDLVLTWGVSLAIAAAIVGTTVACGLYDLALLGGAVFMGLPVIRTVAALRRRRDDGLPY